MDSTSEKTPYRELNEAGNQVKISEADTEEGIKLWKQSLVGRVITRKQVNKNAMQDAFKGIWENPKGFRVVEIKPCICQLYFGKEDGLNIVLKEAHESQWLI